MIATIFVWLMVEKICRFLHGRYTIVNGILNRGELFVLLTVSLILLATPIQRKIIPSNAYIFVEEGHKKTIDWAVNHFEHRRLKLLLGGMPQQDYIEYADACGWLAEKGIFPHVFAIKGRILEILPIGLRCVLKNLRSFLLIENTMKF